jgi:hypothetical protein
MKDRITVSELLWQDVACQGYFSAKQHRWFNGTVPVPDKPGANEEALAISSVLIPHVWLVLEERTPNFEARRSTDKRKTVAG